MPRAARPTSPTAHRGLRARRQRRLALLALGAAIALIVVALQSRGWLDWLDDLALDLRMVATQWSSPTISDRIVHVDIDQRSIEELGRWPWDRSKLAMAVDTMREAGARVIVLDILLDEPQQPRLEAPDWAASSHAEGPVLARRINDDERLARAIERAGNVIIAATAPVRMASPDADDPTARTLTLRRPIPAFEQGALDIGFVNIELGREAEGAIRRVPGAAVIDDEQVLQLGVLAAIRGQRLRPTDLTATPSRLQLPEQSFPLRNGRMIVPWGVRKAADPLPGSEHRPGEAQTGRDLPAWLRAHESIPISQLVRIQQERHQLLQRFAQAVAILTGADIVDDEPSEEAIAEALATVEFLREMSSPEELASQRAELRAKLDAGDDSVRHDLTTLDAVHAWDDLHRVHTGDDPRHRANIDLWRPSLEDRIVFVGFTYTGALADFYPTALGVRTPGVRVHAAVTDGMLTGRWFRDAPGWFEPILTLIVGLSATFVAVSLPASRSWLAAIALTTVYILFDFFLAFLVLSIVLASSAPIIAALAAWAGCTTLQAVQEGREKAAIRRQFRARVSEQLVDVLSDDPTAINMQGEERELTIMFTDFAGFTSLSEKLKGAQTVGVLNRFLREITEAMLERGGYVNKFLGDGAMAFWGAPIPDEHHAANACRAAIEASRAVERLNNAPEHEGMPKLGMRIGIATGSVIVGDCGAPPRLNDYTVIGDAANLASRLESANKMLGTHILVNARLRDMLDPATRDGFTWRLVGTLRVVGQQTPTEVWELIVPESLSMDDAELARWIELSAEANRLFRAGDYKAAIEAYQDLVLFERGQGGALLYIQRCSELIESGNTDPVLPLRSK